jgi:hypothetical protein
VDAGPLLREREPRRVDRQDAAPVHEEQGLRGRGTRARGIAPGEESDRLRLIDIDGEPDPAGPAGQEVGAVSQGARSARAAAASDDQESEEKQGRRNRAREEGVLSFFHEPARRVVISS